MRSDQTISLSGFYAAQDYPDKLRRVPFYDEEQQRGLVAIVRKRAKNEDSLLEILQVLSVSVFDKTPVRTPFSEARPAKR